MSKPIIWGKKNEKISSILSSAKLTQIMVKVKVHFKIVGRIVVRAAILAASWGRPRVLLLLHSHSSSLSSASFSVPSLLGVTQIDPQRWMCHQTRTQNSSKLHSYFIFYFFKEITP